MMPLIFFSFAQRGSNPCGRNVQVRDLQSSILISQIRFCGRICLIQSDTRFQADAIDAPDGGSYSPIMAKAPSPSGPVSLLSLGSATLKPFDKIMALGLTNESPVSEVRTAAHSRVRQPELLELQHRRGLQARLQMNSAAATPQAEGCREDLQENVAPEQHCR